MNNIDYETTFSLFINPEKEYDESYNVMHDIDGEWITAKEYNAFLEKVNDPYSMLDYTALIDELFDETEIEFLLNNKGVIINDMGDKLKLL